MKRTCGFLVLGLFLVSFRAQAEGEQAFEEPRLPVQISISPFALLGSKPNLSLGVFISPRWIVGVKGTYYTNASGEKLNIAEPQYHDPFDLKGYEAGVSATFLLNNFHAPVGSAPIGFFGVMFDLGQIHERQENYHESGYPAPTRQVETLQFKSGPWLKISGVLHLPLGIPGSFDENLGTSLFLQGSAGLEWCYRSTQIVDPLYSADPPGFSSTLDVTLSAGLRF